MFCLVPGELGKIFFSCCCLSTVLPDELSRRHILHLLPKGKVFCLFWFLFVGFVVLVQCEGFCFLRFALLLSAELLVPFFFLVLLQLR